MYKICIISRFYFIFYFIFILLVFIPGYLFWLYLFLFQIIAWWAVFTVKQTVANFNKWILSAVSILNLIILLWSSNHWALSKVNCQHCTLYIYIKTNDWTMPGGATTCLNTTIFKSNVFCVLYAIQIFDKACFVLTGLIRNMNIKHIAVNTPRGMAKVSYMHLTMMVLPGREPDMAINIMTWDRELGTRWWL